MSRSTFSLMLPDGPGALHERLASGIEYLIADDALRTGDRLPPHRDLSRQAGVSIGTVTKAIELLTARGVLRGEVGRGTFVTDINSLGSHDAVVDLTINGPPPVINAEIFASAAETAALKAAKIPHSGYADLAGTDEQRATLADWLARTRLKLARDAFLVTVGAQQAIHLAFQDLRHVSPSIASETATFTGAIVAAQNLDMPLLAVAHDEQGMLPDALDAVLKSSGCRAVYTTPVCQNPLGFEVGPARRKAILEVCERHDAFLVEDDIYSLYAASSAAPYKMLAPDRTYYVTSLSKCMTPLLRVGILAPPSGRRAPIVRRIRAEIWGAPPLSIEIACAMLDLSADITIAEILRDEAKARTAIAAELLGLEALPMPNGAPHIWLNMSPLDAERLARRAAEHNVRLTPPDANAVGPEAVNGIRLCVMAPSRRDRLEHALRVVAHLLASDETDRLAL